MVKVLEDINKKYLQGATPSANTQSESRQMNTSGGTLLDDINKKYGVQSNNFVKGESKSVVVVPEKENPTLAERLGNIFTGSAKSYGAGAVSAAGVTSDVLSASQKRVDEVRKAEEIARYQRNLDTLTADLASAKTDKEREKIEKKIQQTKNYIDQWSSFETGFAKDTEVAAEKLNKTADTLAASAQGDIDEAKDGLGFGGQLAVDLGVAGAQLAGDALVAAMTGGSSLLPMAVRSFGGSAQEARQEGATLGQQVAYGAASAALSAGIEKLSNVAKPLSKMFGKGVADDFIAKLSGKLGETVAGRAALSAIGEGGEEFLEGILSPVLQRIYDEDAKITVDTLAEAGYNALIGAGLGGVLGTVGEVNLPNRATQDSSQTETANDTTAPAKTTTDESAAEAIVAPTVVQPKDALESVLLESVSTTARQINEIAKDPAQLERLGIDPNGKTASQLRAEVREVLAPKTEDSVERAAEITPQSVKDTNSFDTSQSQAYNETVRNKGVVTPASEIAQKYGVVVSPDGRGKNASGKRSEQAQSVIDRAAKGEEISLQELNAIPEVAMAIEETASGVETNKLPNRGDVIRNGLSEALKRGSFNGKSPEGKDLFDGEIRRGHRIDIVTGVAGSGKSSVYSNRISGEHGSRIIDTDDYREYIPEYNGRNAKLVHEEASQIKDEVLAHAIENGENILLSTVGDNPEKLARNIVKYRELGYDVHLHLNHLDNAKSVGRVIARYVNTRGEIGRLVPLDLVKRMGNGPLRAYLEITGQGGNYYADGGNVGQILQGVGGDRGARGVSNGGDAGPAYRRAKEALASWDAYDNDVEFGKPARFLADISRPEVTSETKSDPFVSAIISSARGDTALDDAGNTVGAAQQGFDPFTALQNQYGTLPSGENPVRSDDVPVSTNGTDRVSQSVVTEKGARVTPDEFVPLIEKETVKGGFSFIPITNDATVQKAVAEIESIGWDAALREWTAKVRKGITGADVEAMGALLYNNAVNSGDFRLALDILTDYNVSGRNAARALQARRILKKLEPQSRLYMIERSIQRMVDDMNIDQKITIPKAMLDAYTNAENEAARDDVVGEIQQYVADNIPSTKMDKWKALRYTNMLGNFKTQVRNVAGNITMAAINDAQNAVAAFLETVTRGKAGRAHSVAFGKELLDATRADFAENRDVIVDEYRYADDTPTDAFTRGVMEKRTIFKWKPLEGYRELTNYAMNNAKFGDEAFSRRAYSRALASYLKANNVTAEMFNDPSWRAENTKFLDKARAAAKKNAQEATFRDHNTLSDWVSKIGRRHDTPAAVKAVAEGVLPFRRTPANILVRAAEYSPLGLVKNAVDIAKAARGGDVSGTDVIDGIAKTLTGSGIFALGMLLRNAGLLRGGSDDDEKQQAFDELTGHQDYSLELPDGTSITLDWLTPASMPLFVGAELYDLIKDGGFELKDIERAILSIADPMLEMSMIQGVNDTLDSLQYAEGNNLGQLVGAATLSYLTQGVTNSLLGQITRSFEDESTMTYVDKDSALPDWMQKELGKVARKTPFLDYNQIPYIDAWGRTEEQGGFMERVANNLFNPAYVDTVEVGKVETELQRLYDKVGSDKGNVFPTRADKSFDIGEEKYYLDADEYVKYATAKGQYSYKFVDEAVNSTAYKNMSDGDKAKLVSKLYEYANYKAKRESVPKYKNDDYEKVEKAEKRGISPAEYYAVRANDLNGNDYLDQDEARDGIRKAGMSQKDGDVLMAIMFPKK